MMKVGDVFFTVNGRIGKIINEFAYGDGYKLIGAVWDGARWVALRLNEQGLANTGTGDNFHAGLEKWMNFYNFSLNYNPQDKTWEGTGAHRGNAALNVRIIKYEQPEKVLLEMKKAAYEKMVDYLKPMGYTLEMEDVKGE
jgi:hypothetical protein